jgi:hypothetical protein
MEFPSKVVDQLFKAQSVVIKTAFSNFTEYLVPSHITNVVKWALRRDLHAVRPDWSSTFRAARIQDLATFLVGQNPTENAIQSQLGSLHFSPLAAGGVSGAERSRRIVNIAKAIGGQLGLATVHRVQQRYSCQM